MGASLITVVLDASVALARLWTRVYTWGAPPTAAWERRAEIDSDLWEMIHAEAESQDTRLAGSILARLVRGMADDIAWRAEHFEPDLAMRRAVAMGCAVILVVLFWALPSRLASGRAEVTRCASAASPAESTPEYRLQIVSCAGAFFTRPR